MTVRGPDLPQVDARADVGLREGVSLAALRVAAARSGELAVVTARDVRFGGGGMSVEDARIEGLGAPVLATANVTPQRWRVKASTEGVDLLRVARLASLEKQLQGGTLAFAGDVQGTGAAARGRVTVDATHLRAGQANELSAHVDASLAGRRLAAEVQLKSPTAGTVDVHAVRVDLGAGTALSPGAWAAASGAVDVDAHVDLLALASLLPPAWMPLGEAQGRVTVQAHVERAAGRGARPAAKVTASTEGLVLAPRVPIERDLDGVLVHPLPSWRLVGIDFSVDAQADGPASTVRLSATARDGRGPLATLDAGAERFPYDEVLRGAGGDLRRNLAGVPLDVHLAVPSRGLQTVPALLRQSYLTGKLHGDVTVRGTLTAPELKVTAAVEHAGFAGNATTTPFDVDIAASYERRLATASVKARAAGRERLDLEARVQADAALLLAGGAAQAPLPWTGSARAHVDAFPLGAIGVLDDRGLSGDVRGDVSLVGLHDDARADVQLAIDRLAVGSFTYKDATVKLTADGHGLDGTVRVDQSDGFLSATSRAAASWGAALAPTLDGTKPLDASVSAKNFRIAVLLPFVRDFLDELDGRLDASTRIQLDPRTRSGQLDGTLSLRQGTVEAPAGGGELHDITADVKLTPDGRVTLERLTASGMTGHLQATGEARVVGTTLQSAHAVVIIPSGHSIPLEAAGTDVGDVDGRVVLDLASTPGHATSVKVGVPQLDVKLPEAGTTDAQSLGPMAKVRIGAHRGDPARFVLLPLDPPRRGQASPQKESGPGLTIETHLGNVTVVRGTQLRVELAGDLKVAPGAPDEVTGRIRLRRGGTLSVQGRTFTVDSGTISFVGSDPANPEVVVKAGWTAPDGTIVYATFTGPLKTGKVTLSSEPQLPREEIVQLLLFGAADGVQAGGTENTAIATAGGEAAQPLNHMLNQLGLGKVTAKVDTSEAANPRPEVEVQIARDISLQVAVVLGQPPPGVNPDVTLLTLDWRFLTKWSLATTVGNAGTTIFDLLWQKRY